MLDRYMIPVFKPPLRGLAKALDKLNINADQVSVCGFIIGMVSVAMVATGHFYLALLCLLLNRLADGIDGELARLQNATDAGGFLDITLDFIFYGMFPVGFALFSPADNALMAAVLVASFVGTGASFLAFSSMAQRYNIEHPDFDYKGFYYLDGLAEGTETILCFVLMCLLPGYFAVIALVFALLCILTTTNRVVFGYRTLKAESQ